MVLDGDTLVIGDVRVREGTTLFHRRSGEVLWCQSVNPNFVLFETVEGYFRISRENFERMVIDGMIDVESPPVGMSVE